MTEQKPGFIAQIRSYPAAFWVANTMEIFERLSWYGWFTVMALYVTAPPETGGLGFSTETRGNLMGIVPFFLYLTPVLTGALADRFGFKKMFIIAYLVMIVSYYLLGQFYTVPTFFLAFMFVAVGAAIFKPVVVGTVARVTNESNSSLGFGIFYMMVNVGGFVGPIVAGYVRGWSWKYVFVACSFWALVNLIIVILFYKEPPKPETGKKEKKRSILETMAEVLGNYRFVITCLVVLLALMLAGLGYSWFTWMHCVIFIVGWIAVNFIYDTMLPSGGGRSPREPEPRRSWIAQRMRCSNWRFAIFLLIMSGFWTSFNQIFITMPEYIRDFTDTRPLITAFESVFGESDPEDPSKGIAAKVATINDDERDLILRTLRGLSEAQAAQRLDETVLDAGARTLTASGTPLSPTELQGLLDKHQDDAAAFQRELAERAESAASTDSPRRLAIVTAVKELMDLSAEERLDDEAIKGGGLKLWAHYVRLPSAKIETVVKKADDAAEAADELITASREDLARKLVELHARKRLQLSVLEVGAHELLASKVRLAPDALKELIITANHDVERLTDRAIIQARQFNPEFIININAGGIVLFQVLVSFFMARFRRFTTMIVGMIVAGVGIGLSAFAGAEGMLGLGASVWIVAAGLLTFSFGEMMASPTSQEYVGRIAPADKKALYMGYYFVAIALGNLFGGILSGQMYGKFARDMQRPDLMWMVFGGLMLATALVFMLYNKFAFPKGAAHTLTPDTASD